MSNVVKEKAFGIGRSLGKAALHALAPDDFEYYMCSFELVNSNYDIIDTFSFPVMPDAMSINRQSLASIKRSNRTYHSQITDSFVGKTISISGTFGRKFRLLVSANKNKNLQTRVGGQLDFKYKNGYGMTKYLEKIIESSFERVDEVPSILIFNNLAFNQSFVVEVLNFSPRQSLENNMMWNYSIEMKALADANNLSFIEDSNKRLVDLLANDILTKTASSLFELLPISELRSKTKSFI